MASRAMLSLFGGGDEFGARYMVQLTARLSTTTDDLAVEVREIWQTGALIEGAGLPCAGKDVLLCRAGGEIFGTIVSREGDCCTVEFEEEMDEGDLLLWARPTGAEGAAEAAPRFRRPDLNSPPRKVNVWKLSEIHGYSGGGPAFGD